jgi:hypothetical protein
MFRPLLLALAALCLTPLLASAATVAVNVSPNQSIRALGGIEVDGVLYDVAFDGNFGASVFDTELEALEAGQAIANVFNNYGPNGGIFPYTYPTVDNEAGGMPNGTGSYFEITFEGLPGAGGEYIRGQYMAGWGVWNPAEPSTAAGNQVEATFRLHIPGDVIHNVPEPGAAILAAFGASLLLRRRLVSYLTTR